MGIRGEAGKMKTLFITYNGATEPLIRSQGIPYLKGLSKNGINCVIMSFEKTSADKKVQEEIEKELHEAGIEWVSLRYHKSPSLPATFFDIICGVVYGTGLAVSRGVDVIHARATVPAVMAFFISRLSRKKFIYDERGLMAEEYADGGMWKRGGLLYKAARYIERRLLVGADSVIVLTQNIKKFLTEGSYLPSVRRLPPIDVIACCVDLGRFSYRPEYKRQARESVAPSLGDGFVFIYTGSLGTWYMLDEMLDFYAVARRVIPGARLLIVTHSDRKTVAASAAKRGFAPDEVIAVSAGFDEMSVYLNAADAGLFFIKPVLSKRSSCPIKFAEYLACGLPVVINSGIGDTAAVVNDGPLGAVVKGFSRAEYEKAALEIVKLTGDGNTPRLCRLAAERMFSLDSGIEKYQEVYNRLSITGKG